MAADAIIPGGIILALNHRDTFLLTRYTLSLGSLFGVSRQTSVRVLPKLSILHLVTFFNLP